MDDIFGTPRIRKQPKKQEETTKATVVKEEYTKENIPIQKIKSVEQTTKYTSSEEPKVVKPQKNPIFESEIKELNEKDLEIIIKDDLVLLTHIPTKLTATEKNVVSRSVALKKAYDRLKILVSNKI